jgi:TM2 domain-containing membrane protein YozV
MILPPDSIYTSNMTPQQRAWFYAEYARASKDEIVGLLFALLLGGFGIHKFYLHRTTAGVFYLLFFWTGIPHILGFIDCFFMPRNVRAYNAAQASYIAAQILNYPPPTGPDETPAPASTAVHLQPVPAIPTFQPCIACGRFINPTAPFCPQCGAWQTRRVAT